MHMRAYLHIAFSLGLLLLSLIAVGQACPGSVTDCDGDGIPNSIDLDDDNDGILDVDEGPCVPTISTFWSVNSSTQVSSSYSGFVTSVSFQQISSNTSMSFSPNGAFNSTNFWSNLSVPTSNSFEFNFTWDSYPEYETSAASNDAGTGRITITFNQPADRFVLHIDRLGGFGSDGWTYYSNSMEWSLITSGVTMNKLAGNNQFIVTSSKFYREPYVMLGGHPGIEATYAKRGMAAGSIEFLGNGMTSVSFDVTGIGVEGLGSDGVELIVELCDSPDTDGDGIKDKDDTDSDNDGCPDAIEGEGLFIPAQLDANDMLIGSVSSNGVPTIFGSPQADATAVRDAGINTCPDACGPLDADSDGVHDICDEDDDNDGILDVIECPLLRAVPAGGQTGTLSVSGSSAGGTYSITQNSSSGYSGVNYLPSGTNGIRIQNEYVHSGDDAFSYTINVTPNSGWRAVIRLYSLIGNRSLGTSQEASDYTVIWPGGGTATYYDPAMPDWDMYEAIRTGGPIPSYFDKGNRQIAGLSTHGTLTSGDQFEVYQTSNPYAEWYVEFPQGVNQVRVDKTVHNNGSTAPACWSGGAVTDPSCGIDSQWPLYGLSADQSPSLTPRAGESYREWITFDVYFIADTDGDGYVDCVDTDSDGDGCPDAMEGAAGFTYSHMTASDRLIGSVDSHGVPTIAGSPQASTPAVLDDDDGIACGCKTAILNPHVMYFGRDRR